MTATITTALNSAVSGLRVTQKSLDVTAQNISNADTDGYTKKLLPQSNLLVDGVGVGVSYGEITRYVDQAVQRDYRTQIGMQNYSSTMETYLSRVTGISGATDSETNIGASLGNLYNSFVTLSASPDSTATQNSAIAAAQSFASKLNDFSSQLQNIRNDTQTALKTQVDTLNNTLQNIAQVNRDIANATAVGRSTADLEDKRDVLVKQVSGQLNVTYYTDGTGVLVLQTTDGHVLVDRDARPVSFTSTDLTPSSLYPTSSLVSGVVLHDSSTGPGVDLAAGSPGGTIGALLTLRDQTLPTYNAELDELADKTMMRFNEQGLTMFTDSNGTVPPNDPTQYVGIAGRIQVNTAVVNNPALVQQGTTGTAIPIGSTDVIDKIINYTFGKTKDASGTPNTPFNLTNTGGNGTLGFTITGDPNTTLQKFANGFLDGQATDYSTAKSNADTETAYATELNTRLMDTSSVNTDEEMTKLIQYQRSYGASAKMITALDDLFTQLLNAI